MFLDVTFFNIIAVKLGFKVCRVQLGLNWLTNGWTQRPNSKKNSSGQKKSLETNWKFSRLVETKKASVEGLKMIFERNLMHFHSFLDILSSINIKCYGPTLTKPKTVLNPKNDRITMFLNCLERRLNFNKLFIASCS